MKHPWNPTKTTRDVYGALERLGGKASTEEIAKATDMSNNGASVALGAILRRGYVKIPDRSQLDWRSNASLRNKVVWEVVKPLPAPSPRVRRRRVSNGPYLLGGQH